MLASLPMYDLPELRDATDAWWAGLAGHLRRHGMTGVPDTLDRATGREDAWLSPDLLLSQTCGYPLTHALAGKVEYVATPVYDAPGCAGPKYCSAIVVRADNPAGDLSGLQGSICAFNGTDSHSGYNALRYEVSSLAGGEPFFSGEIITGSHRNSVAAVASGYAGVAAIDCVTFALLSRYASAEVAAVRVLRHSVRSPGLPYITAAGIDSGKLAAIRQACLDAVRDDALADVRSDLLMDSIAVLDADAYDAIPAMEAEARRLGDPSIV